MIPEGSRIIVTVRGAQFVGCTGIVLRHTTRESTWVKLDAWPEGEPRVCEGERADEMCFWPGEIERAAA